MFGAQQSVGMFGAAQAAPQQMHIEMGKDGRPITHETMFVNLPDQWQHAFKQVHGKLVEVHLFPCCLSPCQIHPRCQNALATRQRHTLSTPSPTQVRRDWRSLKSSVGVLESVGPEQEHAELAAASKQLRDDLATAQKVLDLDSGAADAFHANVIALAEATQTAHDQLKVNVVRREIETTRVCTGPLPVWRMCAHACTHTASSAAAHECRLPLMPVSCMRSFAPAGEILAQCQRAAGMWTASCAGCLKHPQASISGATVAAARAVCLPCRISGWCRASSMPSCALPCHAFVLVVFHLCVPG